MLEFKELRFFKVAGMRGLGFRRMVEGWAAFAIELRRDFRLKSWRV